MVVRDSPEVGWKIIGEDTSAQESEDVEVTDGGDPTTATGQKRPRSGPDEEAVQAKRLRESDEDGPTTSPTSCLAPPLNPVAQTILSAARSSESSNLGAGDVFLTEGWRERWCQCIEV